MTDTLYPPTPAVADTSFLKPSPDFKQKARRVVTIIALFPFLYLSILLLGVVLLFGLSYAAYELISLYAFYLTFIIGAFLFMLGLVFFYFTLRFVFGTNYSEEPVQIEIERKDHPLLFDFIGKVAKDVGVPFPKKVFLTPDVNAGVSYNSSFWSMFFPVRKNLVIGLGLVNNLNLSEFKAVIAHEFGHFSQKSMKAGSYVYTMNRVMFDLVYQRDHVENEVREWADNSNLGMLSAMLALFADLTDWFVTSLRKIMHQAYSKLNAAYGELSREMEFHSDLVAVSVAGAENVITMLRKFETGSSALQKTMMDLTSLGRDQQKKVGDLYTYHSKIIPLAVRNESQSVQSRLKLRDLWALHPTQEERENNIRRFPIPSPIQNESAWVLFNDPVKTAREMTSYVYELNEVQEDLPEATEEEINTHFAQFNQPRNEFSKTFYGFYDNVRMIKIDIEKLKLSPSSKSFDQLVNPSLGNLLDKNYWDHVDYETLVRLANDTITSEYFEFDGIRYGKRDIKEVRNLIQDEITNDEKRLEEIDKELTNYFYQRAKELGRGDELLNLFNDLKEKQKNIEVTRDFASRIDYIEQQFGNRRLWNEHQVDSYYKSIVKLERDVRKYLGESDPVELWNANNMIREDALRKLFQAVLDAIEKSQTELLEVRAKVDEMRMALVP